MPVRISDLNPPQQEAVTTTEGPLLVLAGAGSGKTRVITYRIAHLLDKGVRPESMLAVSFTNKAADEMRERVDRLCGSQRARGITLSTFHSLGLQILKAEQAALGLTGGFTIYDTADQLGVIREILREAHVADRRLDIKQVLSRISRLKNAGVSAETFIAKLKTMRSINEYDGYAAEIYPRYTARMRALCAFDFDDLLTETLRLLREDAVVRVRWQSRFRYLMIDEYQDTNRCQLDLLRVLADPDRNLAVVGDDDQSIYAWRGAESRNILDFADHFPGAKVIKLEENYRSTGTILRAANAVIDRNQERHKKTLWTQRSDGERITLLTCPDDSKEAEFVAAEIETLRARFRYQLRDFAVLYRSNKQGAAIEEALRSVRIDYRVIGGQAFYERKEVKDAMAYLRLLTYPHDELALRRVINYPPRGLGPTTLERLSQLHKAHLRRSPQASLWNFLVEQIRIQSESHAPLFSGRAPSAKPESGPLAADALGERSIAALTRFVDAVQVFREAITRATPKEVYELCNRYLRELGIHDDLVRAGPSRQIAERRLRNLDDFLRSAERTVEREQPGRDGASIVGRLDSYLNRLTLSAQDDDADDGLRDEVTLSSLHGSKGLEFRVVFLIGIEEGLLPHRRTLDPRETDQTVAGQMEDRRPGSGETDIDEERRLFYVGITRARERLYLSHCEERGGRMELRTPSRFLDDLPKELLRIRDLDSPEKLDPSEEEKVANESLASMLSMLGS